MSDNHDLLNDMYSFSGYEVDDMCSNNDNDACRELCVVMQSLIPTYRLRYVEILDFTQFFDHFVFTPNAENVLEKELKREIPVSVGIELVVVDMSRNA